MVSGREPLKIVDRVSAAGAERLNVVDLEARAGAAALAGGRAGVLALEVMKQSARSWRGRRGQRNREQRDDNYFAQGHTRWSAIATMVDAGWCR